MASSLRLVFSNLVITRSVAPTLVSSASRFLSIDSHIASNRRSYTAMPIDHDFYNQSSPRLLWPNICKMSFEMTTDNNDRRSLRVNIDGPEENDSGALLWFNSSCVDKKDMRVCDKTCSDTKEEMKNGLLNLTVSGEDDDEIKSIIMANILADDIIASWRDTTATRSWAYYDMFSDRSILGKRFCPLIAMFSRIDSFSMYKYEDDNYEDPNHRLHIEMEMPGKQKMKVTKQGLRVSLKNCGLKREEVKTFFDYDTLFIEGKTKCGSHHYIRGIHLPKHIHKRHNMIKRKVKDGVLYLLIPCVEERGDHDQLKTSNSVS